MADGFEAPTATAGIRQVQASDARRYELTADEQIRMAAVAATAAITSAGVHNGNTYSSADVFVMAANFEHYIREGAA